MFFGEYEIEELAKALHHAWMQEKIAQGWVYGPIKDFEKKTHPDLVPYENLPDEKKELDRMYVRDFINILEKAGLKAVRSKDGQSAGITSLSFEDLERLAKASHEFWLEKTKERDPEKNIYFRPYEELPEEAKNLNRRNVSSLIKLLRSKGYKIIKA